MVRLRALLAGIFLSTVLIGAKAEAFVPVCTDLPSGIFSWWSGDNNANDPFGGNDGTFNGPYTAGMFNEAFSFNGTDNYVDLPNGFEDFTSGLTIGLWANPTSNGNWARFIDLGNGSANDNILFARQSTWPDHLAFEVYVGGSSAGMVYAINAIANNEWHHYAVTLNASGNAQLYKDGLPITTYGASTIGMPSVVTRTNNYIGKSNWPQDAYYAGMMDEVVIYDRALAASEIAAIYNTGITGICSQYTLTVEKAGTGTGTVTASGINCGTDCSEIYDQGDIVGLTATPDAGSVFAGWSGDTDCSDGSVTMNADKSCTATFNLAPDLTGSWVSLYSLNGGKNISGTFRNQNLGSANAGSYNVAFYLSSNGTTLGSLLKSFTVSGLNALSSKSFYYSYSSNISLSGKYVIAVIDPANAVSETNEGNNRFARKIP